MNENFLPLPKIGNENVDRGCEISIKCLKLWKIRFKQRNHNKNCTSMIEKNDKEREEAK